MYYVPQNMDVFVYFIQKICVAIAFDYVMFI